MRIECKTTFLDGAERFEAGDIRTVDDARAQLFLAHGWASEVGKPAAPQNTDPANLAINKARMGHGAKHG
jgi:hypothetical protein